MSYDEELWPGKRVVDKRTGREVIYDGPIGSIGHFVRDVNSPHDPRQVEDKDLDKRDRR